MYLTQLVNNLLAIKDLNNFTENQIRTPMHLELTYNKDTCFMHATKIIQHVLGKYSTLVHSGAHTGREYILERLFSLHYIHRENNLSVSERLFAL